MVQDMIQFWIGRYYHLPYQRYEASELHTDINMSHGRKTVSRFHAAQTDSLGEETLRRVEENY